MNLKVTAVQVLASINAAGQSASRLTMPGTAREQSRVAFALLRAAYDDAGAITTLLGNYGQELSGSALTLLRPMNEKFKRGAWFAFCASDQQVQDFIRDDRVPQGNLSAEIEQHPPFNQFPMFTGLFNNASKQFHSYTHGGRQIVAGYTLGEGIGAAFPEADLVTVLKHVESIAITAAHVMCMVAGEYEPTLAEAVLDELASRFVPSPQGTNISADF